MTTPASTGKGRSALKTLPGLLVSAFFLWYTFFPHPAIWKLQASKGISLAAIRSFHIVSPLWIFGVLGFTAASYTLRCVRWTRMMRPVGAPFAVCARVLMTSLAANNILPLRIGDIMRVFTYAGDLGTSPSFILSTVILEKLLDIFMLVLLFVATMGSIATHRYRVIAYTSLAISFFGLLVLLVGARAIQPRIAALFARFTPSPGVAKLEHWISLALDATARLGVAGSLVLLLQTAVVWTCEGMIFLSSLKLVGIGTDSIAPWLAVSFANLSYLIPSSPGAIGPFELAVKTSLVSHGAPVSQAAVFGLALHAWLLLAITGAGGLVFLLHRARIHNHTPLLQEIETLPDELP